MEGFQQVLSGLPVDLPDVYIALLRFAAPLLMALILIRCARPLFRFRSEPEIWGWLRLPDGNALPVTHWENVIGRNKRCDIIIDLPYISRNHAVLTRYDDGSWTVSDAGSKGGVKVNGERVQIGVVHPGDVIDLNGVELKLEEITKRQEERLAQLRTRASGADAVVNLLLLTVFQVLCALGYVLNGAGEDAASILIGFGGIIAAQWVLLCFYATIHRSAFEVETVAFLLCTMGMNVIAATIPQESVKQLIAMYIGLGAFLLVGWSLRDLDRAQRVRSIAAVVGIGLLALTLLVGKEINGAKNWIVLGGLSLQPSELSKVCFVFVGASTMDRIMQKRNLITLIVYSVLMCCLLALMNDFGTALVFFVAFLAVAYMRSGSVGTIGLACSSLGFAGVIALKLAPHALRRFTIWRHVWEDPLNKGYQQVRCLMCVASGGLFGLGAGNGWMKNLFASDTDVVFATVSEEWGLIMALGMVVAIVALAVFCLKSAGMCRSSFYTIGACTAASILLAQTILNVMGTVDLLPFTGVTFPFVSNGGSSMIASWALLGFVKAADTRQNASFAIAMHKKEVDE